MKHATIAEAAFIGDANLRSTAKPRRRPIHKMPASFSAASFAGALVTSEADPEVSCLAVRTRLVDGTFLVSPFAPPPPEFSAGY